MNNHNIPDDVYRQITDALHSGRKIEAVKLYRLATGASLKVSKEFIESIPTEKEVEYKQTPPPAHPGVQSSGCGSSALALVALITGVLLFVW